MIKHTLAVALLGIGIGFTNYAPGHAMPLSGAAVPSTTIADDSVIKVGGRCLDEIPVVQSAVAFFQLLRDEEINTHCPSLFDSDSYDRHTYDERRYPTYKDGGYAQPKDGKGTLR